MNDSEKVREQVSESYTKAVSSGGGCCGETAATGCGGPVQKGVVVKSAGYGESELASLPPDAVSNSFGCGNPVAFSDIREGETVLDLGSGAGIDLLLAARKVGPAGRVIGVDMTDEMIARAEKNIAESGLTNVEVRKGFIEDLPVDSGSVDWVISNCVINLSPEKERVFAEIARVLKPGGRMRVADIVAHDLPGWIRASAALYSSCIAGAIGEDEYADGLRRAGLENVSVDERLVYEGSQLASLVNSEILASARDELEDDLIPRAAEALAGKVWSARFSATKAHPA